MADMTIAMLCRVYSLLSRINHIWSIVFGKNAVKSYGLICSPPACMHSSSIEIRCHNQLTMALRPTQLIQMNWQLTYILLIEYGFLKWGNYEHFSNYHFELNQQSDVQKKLLDKICNKTLLLRIYLAVNQFNSIRFQFSLAVKRKLKSTNEFSICWIWCWSMRTRICLSTWTRRWYGLTGPAKLVASDDEWALWLRCCCVMAHNVRSFAAPHANFSLKWIHSHVKWFIIGNDSSPTR